MGIELGVGESLITKAISEATGKTKAAVTRDYQAKGDLGNERIYFGCLSC
jgi:DNA ligase-1